MHGHYRADRGTLRLLLPFLLLLATVSTPPATLLAGKEAVGTDAVGRLVGPDGTQRCTVFRIGKDTLVTAGHCLVPTRATKIAFDGNIFDFSPFWTGESMGVSMDWAFLYVPPKYLEGVGQLRVAERGGHLPESVYVDGYSAGVRVQTVCARWPWWTGPGLSLRCNTPMAGGISGAPVYREGTVYGVVTHLERYPFIVLATDLRGRQPAWPPYVYRHQ